MSLLSLILFFKLSLSLFFGGEGCGVCHEAKPNGLLTRDLGGEGSNCFSITKIVGQKRQ